MNFININNELFEIILYSLNEKKRISFLKISVKHVNNREEEFVFAMKFLNV